RFGLRLADLVPRRGDQRRHLLAHAVGADPHRRDIAIKTGALLGIEIELRRHALIALLLAAQIGRRVQADPQGAADKDRNARGGRRRGRSGMISALPVAPEATRALARAMTDCGAAAGGSAVAVRALAAATSAAATGSAASNSATRWRSSASSRPSA